MTASVRHPLFARCYARVATLMERRGAAEHRVRLLAGLSGRVVEVGAGGGHNFAYYPRAVTEVVAVEPEPYLRALARAAAAEAAVAVSVVDGVADALPADDGAFDAGVLSLVLCSVPDPGRALAELRRVLRPGGELRFYEHVLDRSPAFARFQRAADAVWPLLAGGCHTARDSPAAVAAAGFDVTALERFRFPPGRLPIPASPHVLGVARRRP